jgi:hypothetical protein
MQEAISHYAELVIKNMGRNVNVTIRFFISVNEIGEESSLHLHSFNGYQKKQQYNLYVCHHQMLMSLMSKLL